MIRRFSLFAVRMEYQILASIIAAVVCALLWPSVAIEAKVLGAIYLNLLKFIVAPLLFFSVFASIVGLGSIQTFGRLGLLTFGLYMVSSFLAIFLSLLFMHIFTPGVGVDLPSGTVSAVTVLGMEHFLLSLVPTNIIAPFLESNMMQLVVISVLFGLATLSIADAKGRENLYASTQTLTEVVLKFTAWIIALTPIGVFGLVTFTIAQHGLQPILALWKFVLVVLGALAFHLVIVLPLLAYAVSRMWVYSYLFRLKHVMLFAFSTASSSATMPLSLTETVSKGGVHRRIAQLVLPIGASINMDGTALYQAAVALFVAQAMGMQLDVTAQLLIAVTVVMASIGAAGVPGAGLVMLATVFATVGLPLEAIGVVMVVDRFLDMFRTMVNVSGDMIVAKVVNARFERDTTTL